MVVGAVSHTETVTQRKSKFKKYSKNFKKFERKESLPFAEILVQYSAIITLKGKVKVNQKYIQALTG